MLELTMYVVIGWAIFAGGVILGIISAIINKSGIANMSLYTVGMVVMFTGYLVVIWE